MYACVHPLTLSVTVAEKVAQYQLIPFYCLPSAVPRTDRPTRSSAGMLHMAVVVVAVVVVVVVVC